MTIRECYEKLGGNFDEVLGRMMNKEALVQKFLLKFLNDESYGLLTSSLEEGDGETAFRAAHTLKGVSQNLALTRLAETAVPLTEMLRGGQIPPEAEELAARLGEDYTVTVEAIREFQAGLPE